MGEIATVAVIDIGKTNAKLALIERASGAEIALCARSNAPLRAPPYPQADTEGLWDFILSGLAALHAAHGVSAIAVTTHGATAALLAGEALALPVLDYEHDGPEETAAAYDMVRPEFAESLSPRLPAGLNLGAQLFWQARRFPAAFAHADAVLAYPQYWAWRLSGAKASEATSLGCHTDLWVPGRGEFSSLVARQGWQALFPPLRPAADVIGTLRPELADATGLDPATPVACGLHDSNASLLAHLAARPLPFTVISSGTWTVCMTPGGSTTRLDAGRDSLANVDAFGRPVPTARFMGGREFDLLGAPAAVPTSEDVEAVLAAGIQALPGAVPGVGPFPAARGGWTVPIETLAPGRHAAAVALYLALVSEAALELCGVGREIVLEGPLARNELYGAALSALTGVPVLASADATGTSLGAAMLFGPLGGSAGETRRIAPLAHRGLARYRDLWRSRI